MFTLKLNSRRWIQKTLNIETWISPLALYDRILKQVIWGKKIKLQITKLTFFRTPTCLHQSQPCWNISQGYSHHNGAPILISACFLILFRCLLIQYWPKHTFFLSFLKSIRQLISGLFPFPSTLYSFFCDLFSRLMYLLSFKFLLFIILVTPKSRLKCLGRHNIS